MAAQVVGAEVSAGQRDWETDAREVGDLHRRTGAGLWRAAYLVALHVEPARAGRPRKSAPKQPITRVSLNAFSEVAGISRVTVQRYFATWQAAAVGGKVPEASTLGSHQPKALESLSPDDWKQFYPKRALPAEEPGGLHPATDRREFAPAPPVTAEDVLSAFRTLTDGCRVIARVDDSIVLQIVTEPQVAGFMDAAARVASRVNNLRKVKEGQ